MGRGAINFERRARRAVLHDRAGGTGRANSCEIESADSCALGSAGGTGRSSTASEKRRRAWLVVSALIAVTASTSPGARTPTAWAASAPVSWQQLEPPNSPPARHFQASSWDSFRQRFVVFGGQLADGTAADDTWEWDGELWRSVKGVDGPPALLQPSMAYHEALRETVLVGSVNANEPFVQVWSWNGVRWRRWQLAEGPSARFNHRVAYDADRRRIVLFGGASFEGNTVGDTWELTEVWLHRVPAHAPSLRASHGMTWDPVTRRILVFGGWAGPMVRGWGGQWNNETWTWDGADWIQLTPTKSPSPRVYHAQVADPARNRVLIFGGDAQTVVQNELWEWNGQTWAPLAQDSPPAPRDTPSIAVDPASGRMFLFGGAPTWANTIPFGDTWQAKLEPATVDVVAPRISSSVSPQANSAGWRNTPVRVAFQCEDDMSGVATCPADVVLDASGRDQSVTGTAIDNAGNTASVTVSGIHIDREAPTVSVDGESEPVYARVGANDVVEGACADELSGVEAVTVVFERQTISGPPERFESTARLQCTGAGCRWEADVPRTPGRFRLSAVARDLAGNERTASVRSDALIVVLAG